MPKGQDRGGEPPHQPHRWRWQPAMLSRQTGGEGNGEIAWRDRVSTAQDRRRTTLARRPRPEDTPVTPLNATLRSEATVPSQPSGPVVTTPLGRRPPPLKGRWPGGMAQSRAGLDWAITRTGCQRATSSPKLSMTPAHDPKPKNPAAKPSQSKVRARPHGQERREIWTRTADRRFRPWPGLTVAAAA
jgi:hypothetical protein